ncbi:MAG: ATP-binding cassette domain-containing protein [Pseudomonadota bacterium]
MHYFELVKFSAGPIDKESFLTIIKYTHEKTSIAIIGDNGSGKSTLLDLLANAEKYVKDPLLNKPYNGDIKIKPNLKIGYFNQNPNMDLEMTIEEYILNEPAIKHKINILKEYEQISLDMASANPEQVEILINKQLKLQSEIDEKNLWDIEREIDSAMQALGCPNKKKLLKNTSGGEKRRVALCALLFQETDVMLLDEPTNHLDIHAIAWLEKHLQKYQGMLILITHDRQFLERTCNWILEIDQGQLIPFKGDYTSWLKHKEKQAIQIAKEDDLFKKHLKQEREWIGKSNKTKTKAQIRQMEQKSYEESLKYRPKKSFDQIYIPPGPRLGNRIISVKDLSYTIDNKQLFKDLSFEIPKGATVGVIGPNGAGKTTLMRMIIGDLKPDTGEISHGESIKIAYNDQTRTGINPNNTIWQEISGGHDIIDLQAFKINSRAYVAAFNFRGNAQQTKMKDVSGGEQNRVHLAKTLTQQANVLILDEPTNDLDMKTSINLKVALQTYPGVILIVSHDRSIIKDICSHLIIFDGKGNAVFTDDFETNMLK